MGVRAEQESKQRVVGIATEKERGVVMVSLWREEEEIVVGDLDLWRAIQM